MAALAASVVNARSPARLNSFAMVSFVTVAVAVWVLPSVFVTVLMISYFASSPVPVTFASYFTFPMVTLSPASSPAIAVTLPFVTVTAFAVPEFTAPVSVTMPSSLVVSVVARTKEPFTITPWPLTVRLLSFAVV